MTQLIKSLLLRRLYFHFATIFVLYKVGVKQIAGINEVNSRIRFKRLDILAVIRKRLILFKIKQKTLFILTFRPSKNF
jgi:hypothetical protein